MGEGAAVGQGEAAAVYSVYDAGEHGGSARQAGHAQRFVSYDVLSVWTESGGRRAEGAAGEGLSDVE